MENNNETRRALPQVEKLLASPEFAPEVEKLGRGFAADIIRGVIGNARIRMESGETVDAQSIPAEALAECEKVARGRLSRVINCTGVLIHTNLGRAPLGKDALAELAEDMGGYSNLEFALEDGKRGKRGGIVEEQLARLIDAEAALVVNNNAAAVFLILSEFANGSEVIVSRGELIQIGGGFRIPDIMQATGARLVEVGTTNITEAEDYSAALTENTAMIFSAHRSNHKMTGFVRSPSIREIAAVKPTNVVFVRDLGSGNFIGSALPDDTPAFEIRQGADIVCFSGDKLFGSCQAGIIVGKEDAVSRLRKNPLMRVLRPDKITLYLLSRACAVYSGNRQSSIPLLKMIKTPQDELQARAAKVIRKVKHDNKSEHLAKIKTKATFGGGALPGYRLQSAGICLNDIPTEAALNFLRGRPLPVIGGAVDGVAVLDMMTLFEDEIGDVAAALDALLEKFYG